MNNRVTAIVPVFNRADLLQRLLATARAQTIPFAEIIVVDNASTDDASDVARAAGCRVIEMGQNTGFARAVNRGWRAAAEKEKEKKEKKEKGTDAINNSEGWVAILNSDVELDPGWLEHLLENSATSSFSTGLILNAQTRNTIDGTYDLVSRSACAWRAGFGEQASLNKAPRPVAIVPATACIFRLSVLEQLGGFDEAFGSYLEDIDLGLRCVREGFTGIYVPSAVAWHHGSATFGRWDPRVVRLTSRNQLLLLSRHYDRTLFRAFLWPIIVGQLLWGLVALRHGTAFAWLAGKRDGLRGFRLEGIYSPRLRDFLTASEREIHTRSRDHYWLWYFRLTARHIDT